MKTPPTERLSRRWKLGGRVIFTAATLSLVWFVAQEGRAEDESNRYGHAALEARKPSQLASAPEPDDPYLAEGQRLYLRYCGPCHGDSGAGNGLAGDYMRPRPRDFTAANYALRTTRSGELPTDADLFRVISQGVPGTTMPAWGEGIFTLTEEERWQVVYYVKTLSEIFWEEYTNPYRSVEGDEPAPILEIGTAPELTDELLAHGRELYLDQEAGGCLRCHGEEGRGDGEAAAEMFDELGQPARPYDMTNPWRNKNGTTVEDIYRTLSSGLSGTPMADFMDGIPEDRDRWALAYYSQSLLEDRTVAEGALHALRVDGELPEDPNDGAWESCTPFGVALMGQYTVAPRWQAPAVDYMRLCALHNEREIAIRVEWNDPFMDAGGNTEEAIDAPEEATGDAAQPEPSAVEAEQVAPTTLEPDEVATGAETESETAEGEPVADERVGGEDPALAEEPTDPAADGDGEKPGTYITIAAMNARAQAESIPDRLALQMPSGKRKPNEAQRPHMFMGDETHPVHAFLWSAEGGGTISEGNAIGPAEDYSAQDADSVQVTGKSEWHRGRWRVVFRRSLATPDTDDDVQLDPGALMPFNLRGWDGSAGERGVQSATSSWHYIYLEMPTPLNAYLSGAAATCIGYMLIGFFWWRVGKQRA